MSSALVRAELSRARLETLLVAHAIADPAVLPTLGATVDPLAVSPACWALLAQYGTEGRDTYVEGKAKRALVDRARAVTLGELYAVEALALETIVALINRLPLRIAPAAGWEAHLTLVRDSDHGT